MLRLLLLTSLVSACGSEAKFHSVYVNGEAPQRTDKDRRIYVCEYEYTYESGLENYVCREIPETSCTIDK